jgi:hypothetical protein
MEEKKIVKRRLKKLSEEDRKYPKDEFLVT